MTDFWGNFLIEIGLFSFLGVLYYFWQKRRIIRDEENKIPIVLGFILQSCLVEKKESAEPELDSLIEALDDYLSNKTPTPPISLLKIYTSTTHCSSELKDIINMGLLELEMDHEKK